MRLALIAVVLVLTACSAAQQSTAPATTPGRTAAPSAPISSGPSLMPTVPESTPLPTLAPESIGRVLVNNLNVRSSASKDAVATAALHAGMDVRVIGGPVSADGFTWYQVKRGPDISGWVADGDASGPWLAQLENGMIAYPTGEGEIAGIDPDSLDRRGLATGQSWSPVWSPDGSSLLFVQDNQIWASSPDGSANPLAEGEGASWSPDGTRILHQRRFGQDGLDIEIYTMGPDGSQATNLTNDPSADFGALWSPDGTQIVFHSNRDGPELYLMDRDGGNVRRLTNSGPDGLSTNPLWEPDSRHLTYSIRSPDDWERRRIDVVTLDEVVVGTEIAVASTWSPDGSMLAKFASAPIELLGPEGELIRQLPIPAEHVVWRPGVWSPDGRYLAVLTVIYCPECGQGGDAGALLIVPIDGSPVIVADEDVGLLGEFISWQAVLAAP